jgi:hypothetical protein
MNEVFPDVGSVKQGFGGNAPDVQAGAAQFRIFLDDCRLQTILARPNGGGVAARTTPNDDQIMCHFFSG